MLATFNPSHPRNSLRADCPACRHLLPTNGCLSHTCPDCGHATDAVYNDRNELVHTCCTTCVPSN